MKSTVLGRRFGDCIQIVVMLSVWLVVPGMCFAEETPLDTPRGEAEPNVEQVLREAFVLRQQLDLMEEDDPAFVAGNERFVRLIQSVRERFVLTETTLNQRQRQTRDAKPLPLNKVELNAAGLGIDAIRFVAPLGADAYDFQWIFMVPPTVTGWYIVPAEGQMRGFTHFYPVDDMHEWVEGAAEDHFGAFQPLDGGHIRSGQEYIIWFTCKTDKPYDLHYWIDLQPVGQPKANAM